MTEPIIDIIRGIQFTVIIVTLIICGTVAVCKFMRYAPKAEDKEKK